MRKPVVDETKLPQVIEIIEKAALLMEEKDCDVDIEAKKDLEKLRKSLQYITGNKKIQIENFQAYWSYTDLEVAARNALMYPPTKENLTDIQVKEIVLNITNCNYSEAETNWWLDFLEINTGLDNLTDYIFYPDLVGLDRTATSEQIADKIMEDKK